MILEYEARRLLFLGLVVIGITALLFLITNLPPTDPARAAAGPGASPEQVENLRHKLGYDQPLHIRYIRYLGDLLRGDLGISTRTRELVLKVLKKYIPASLELMIAAMLLNLLIAVPLGVLSATKPGRLADSSSRLFAAAGMGMPLFWVALLVQLACPERQATTLPGHRFRDRNSVLSGSVARDARDRDPQVNAFHNAARRFTLLVLPATINPVRCSILAQS